MLREFLITPVGNLGIPRSQMPQIRSVDIPDFLNSLKQQGISVSFQKFPVSRLKPTQNEINSEKVDSKDDILTNPKGIKPFVVSKDFHILDGHHQWAALMKVAPQKQVDCFLIGANMLELLQLGRQYPKANKKDIQEGYKADYSSSGFGTERILKVTDEKGNVIGQCDPFWPGGVPVDPKQRQKIIQQAIQRMIKEYESIKEEKQMKFKKLRKNLKEDEVYQDGARAIFAEKKPKKVKKLKEADKVDKPDVETQADRVKEKQDREKEDLRDKQADEMDAAKERDFRDKMEKDKEERKRKEDERKDQERNRKLAKEHYEEGTPEARDHALSMTPGQKIENVNEPETTEDTPQIKLFRQYLNDLIQKIGKPVTEGYGDDHFWYFEGNGKEHVWPKAPRGWEDDSVSETDEVGYLFLGITREDDEISCSVTFKGADLRLGRGPGKWNSRVTGDKKNTGTFKNESEILGILTKELNRARDEKKRLEKDLQVADWKLEFQAGGDLYYEKQINTEDILNVYVRDFSDMFEGKAAKVEAYRENYGGYRNYTANKKFYTVRNPGEIKQLLIKIEKELSPK